MDVVCRSLAEDDYNKIIKVVDDWWGGRNVANMLPRLFFVHFRQTSFVIEENHEPVAFVCGFISPAAPQEAYIHFAGVRPDHRGQGLAKRLYQEFFNLVVGSGCHEVHCVTSLANTGSIAFHTRLGFQVIPGDAENGEGVPYVADYDGPGQDRVLLSKKLDPA